MTAREKKLSDRYARERARFLTGLIGATGPERNRYRIRLKDLDLKIATLQSIIKTKTRPKDKKRPE
jgi:hypothetical protein